MGLVPAEPGLKDEVLTRTAELRAAGETFAVATVVRVDPPTSARPGDKALISPDGKLWGWIGGSCSESLVRREAMLAISDGQPRLVKIAPESAPEHRAGVVSHVSTCPSAGSLDVFIDPHRPPPLLLVVGATPVARTLLRLGSVVGFRTCGVHPGATPADFPGADLVLSSLELSGAGLNADTWAVAATMGHYDEDALTALLAHDLPYAGLVASRRRAASVLQVLTDRGVTGLDRVRRPGQDAVASSQPEIALAALNEIVRERSSRQPVPARDTPETAVDPVCGMKVDTKEAYHVLREAGGVTYFCSAHCRDTFVRSKAAASSG